MHSQMHRFIRFLCLLCILEISYGQKSSSTSSNGDTNEDTSSQIGTSSSFNDSSDSFSNSTNTTQSLLACNCTKERKISLLGASNFCLPPGTDFSEKCGHEKLKEKGICPIKGSEPCSNKGVKLTSDAICERRGSVYKCVASRQDQKNHKEQNKKKKKKTSTSSEELDDGPGNRLSVNPWLISVFCFYSLFSILFDVDGN